MKYAPRFRFLPYLAALATTLALASVSACLKSPTAPPVQEPTTITLSTYRIVFTAVNEHLRIDATVLDQDSRVITDATVNWRSADNSVARVTDRGVVTAAGAGTTQITVSSGYATATATVSVEQAADSIEILPSSITLLHVGETGQFTAVVYDSNNRPIPGAVVVWSSSNPEIATVDANGLVTAVSRGSASITASSGGFSTSRPVNVEIPRSPSRIVLNVTEATLASVGQSLQLDAEVYDSDGAAIPGAAVTWSSSDPEVATVDAGGLVIAVSNGTTRITATSGDATAHATIHVVIEGTEPPEPPEPEPVATRIEIDPTTATLTEAGQTVQLEAVVYDAEDLEIPEAPVTWSSNRPEVATVSTSGLATAVSNGSTRVMATSGDVTAHALIHVAIEEPEPPPPQPEPSSDRDALIALYHATDGPNWTNNTNWLSEKPIGEWYGVSTDADGRVTDLDMLGNNLTGTLPPEIGQLQHIRLLRLTDNQLSGPLPPEIGQLRSLERLVILRNQLNGEIPPEIGQLDNLTNLFLSTNQLSGRIPSEIGNLNSLRSIWMSSNRLSGGIPREISNLESLTDLTISDNQLTGDIPHEIWSLKSLEYIILSNNRFTGEIPSEIGDLKALRWVWLNRNEFTGGLPPEIGNLNALVSLNLEDNQFSGGIPPEFGRLANLEELKLNTNKDLVGPLPVQMTSMSSLSKLELNDTGLCVPSDDTFRAWLAGIEEKYGITFCADEPEPPQPEPSSDRDVLIEFYHATDGPNWKDNTNWLSEEPLGEWYGVDTDADGRVTVLDLNRNNLSGTLIPALGRLSNLNRIWLLDNNISGRIPGELGQLTDLEILALAGNRLSGAIPADLGSLSKLWNLNLSKNRLTGHIPVELGQLNKLNNLDLASNLLTGSIPAVLGQLTVIRDFNLAENQLTGPIPSELGNINNPILRIIDLSRNELNGRIPPELGQLSHLSDRLFLYQNRLSGGIPSELGNLTKLARLDLQLNQLSGRIPHELGNMKALVELDVAENLLSGNIPPEIGRLTNLEVLFLYENTNLGGPLPVQLTSITTLRDLALDGTGLCVPNDETFRAWLAGIEDKHGIAFCADQPEP